MEPSNQSKVGPSPRKFGLQGERRPLKNAGIPRMGPASREKLQTGGIETIGDLMVHLPRDYRDFSTTTRIDQAPLGIPLCVRGQIIAKKRSKTFGKRVSIIEILVDDGSGTIRVVWFNQPYLEKRLEKGSVGWFYGIVRFDKLGRMMNGPEFEIEGEEPAGKKGIEPVYKQIGGLTSKQLAQWIRHSMEHVPKTGILPEALVTKYGFPNRRQAFCDLHQPQDLGAVKQIQERTSPALKRLIFEEFFSYQCRIQKLAMESQRRNHVTPDLSPSWLDRFLQSLPFTLTTGQSRVITNLSNQLMAKQRLHALIQGDVGCGKTLVGFAIAYLFYKAGFQSVLLCPTILLAQQHFATAEKFLRPLGLKTVLAPPRGSSEASIAVLRAIAEGDVHLVIGSHRVFQPDLVYHRLGLAMIDEQHRFGVNQRAALLKKGKTPHYLAFSATPIPRSLALTLFGDFSLMQIKDKPAHRAGVTTIIKKERNRDQIIEFAKARISMGETVFWVVPVIESSDDGDTLSATAMFESLGQSFNGIKIGMVHGRLEKDRIHQEMSAFERGDLKILVATTVIEVGVDIPSASIMVVEGANHFGLSQLHQLRGRVGRGNREAFCFLVIPNRPEKESLKRMKLLQSTQDGFEIAHFDLRQRGSGALLGKLQTGKAGFSIGDPWLDRHIMENARKEAEAFLVCSK